MQLWRQVRQTSEKFWSPEGLTRRLSVCIGECEQERRPPFMCSLMSMLLMCTVSYAGDVHNHVLGINDFITFLVSCVIIYLQDIFLRLQWLTRGGGTQSLHRLSLSEAQEKRNALAVQGKVWWLVRLVWKQCKTVAFSQQGNEMIKVTQFVEQTEGKKHLPKVSQSWPETCWLSL